MYGAANRGMDRATSKAYSGPCAFVVVRLGHRREAPSSDRHAYGRKLLNLDTRHRLLYETHWLKKTFCVHLPQVLRMTQRWSAKVSFGLFENSPSPGGVLDPQHIALSTSFFVLRSFLFSLR